MNFNVDGLLAVLPKAGQGWLGVFIVTVAVILCIWILNAVTSGKKSK